MISVIIPVYNAEKSLRRCVESLFYGKEKNIEIILVEDCSKDNSWSICEDLSREYYCVKCYQNDCNSGVSFTRNHGLDYAKGDYIVFVDSDDWVSANYLTELYEAAYNSKESLIICGLHFIDEVAGYRRDYLWEDNGEDVYNIPSDQFFLLHKKFHIQQLWNKIFYKRIIDDCRIRFDESQSMGEDFQFVLDYMSAASVKNCLVLNKPLYYYIRANSTSLMSKFGVVKGGYEYQRLEQLFQLTGDIQNPSVIKQYEQAIDNLNHNYVYQIVHSNKTKEEKLSFIESIMQDGKAQAYYARQMKSLRRERIFSIYSDIKALPKRCINRFKRLKRDSLAAHMKTQLSTNNISIISQNCIGGVFYHDMGMRFLSPTVNLYFSAIDFIRFVNRLQYYTSIPLKMVWDETYPIGYLDDITIYFMHYESCTEARQAWERRVQRINYDKVLVLCSDMVGFGDREYQEWCKIAYPKLLFSATKWDDGSVVFYPEYQKQGKVSDLIPDRKFYKNGTLLKLINQM